MFLTLLSTTLILFISSIIMFISLTISKKTYTDQEKLSPFECGFTPAITPRTPFSLRFFLIAMIFLIFDVEIVLLLPLPLLNIHPLFVITSSSIFIIILSMGLYYEWKNGALNWAF